MRRLEELLDHVLAAGEAARDGAVRALLGALLREVLVAFRQDWPVLCALLAKRLQAGARADLLLAKWAGRQEGRARSEDPGPPARCSSHSRRRARRCSWSRPCSPATAIGPMLRRLLARLARPALGPTWVLDLAGAIVPAKSLEVRGGTRRRPERRRVVAPS